MDPRRLILLLWVCSLLLSCEPRYPGPQMTNAGVSFTFSAPEAKSVAIAGTFNSWDKRKDKLSGPDRNGMWRIVLPLPEGRYEYLFIVDGKHWKPDPAVPQVDDGFGGKNSVVVIGGGQSL